MSTILTGSPIWQPVALPKWKAGGFGTDRATVTWGGPWNLREKFMASLQKWAPLPRCFLGGVEYFPANNAAWLEDWDASGGTENFPKVDLQYVGFRDGRVPDAKSTNSTSSQSAQGAGTDTATGANVTGSIQYRASRTMWTWFETQTPPATPRFRAVQQAQNPFDTIDRYSITDSDTGKPINSIPLSSFDAVFNSLLASERVSDYGRELIVPGKLWACSSTVDYVLS